MKKLLSLVFLLFMAGCINAERERSLDMNVSLDKNVYHSREIMKIRIGIKADYPLKNAKLRVVSKGKNGKVLFIKEMPFELNKSEKNVTLSYRLPLCSRCAGYPTGIYFVNVSLVYNNGTSIKNCSTFFKLGG